MPRISTTFHAALALAAAVGHTYERDAMGYEYIPAPRSVSVKPNPMRRTGAFTRSGGPARKRAHERASFERQTSRLVVHLADRNKVTAPTHESWEHFIDKRIGKMTPAEAASQYLGL